MDRWEKPLKEGRHRHQRERERERESPSFSSTLLDAIYRSIDESSGQSEEELIFYRETMRKKQYSNNGFQEDGEREMASLRRACMIEKWMEKKVNYDQVVAVRRKSTADFDKKGRKEFDSVLLNSSSSSSESSCGGGFSSSESESLHSTLKSSTSSTTTNTPQRPKPIRTSVSARPEKYRGLGYESEKYHHLDRNYTPPTQKPKHEGSFVKTKSKAMKIYGDLKKVKQPISPGGRFASFLNSLFTTSNAKKAKISTSRVNEERKSKSEQASTCSSASSFSRSCLSKSCSSREKSSNNGPKRSVRFYPVSVIVDEDSRPCGQKTLYGSEESTLMAALTTSIKNPPGEEFKFHVMNENRRVQEVALDLLKKYHRKNEDLDMTDLHSEEEEEEYDDDEASCASSDLFELDNLSSIGIDRYREELPVYETTYLGTTNRAIANGLIL